MSAALIGVAIGSACGYQFAPRAAPTIASRAEASRKADPGAPPALLDDLRQASLLGDAETSRGLATLLMDRYDAMGRNEDLFEAVVWIDRNLYVVADDTLSRRVMSRYCSHPVLQWHPMCLPGE